MTALSTHDLGSQLHVAPSNDPNVGKAERIAATLAGGTLLALALRERGLMGGVIATLGAACLWHGCKRHSRVYAALGINSDDATTWSNPLSREIQSRSSVTIDRSAEELYANWRKLSNLSKYLPHVDSVEETSERESHWIARTPSDQKVEWDARITDDSSPRTIRWESLEGSDFDHRGEITFKPALAGRGTIVALSMHYHLPAGLVGVLAAKVQGVDPQDEAAEALRRFKQWIETGECTTNANKPERPEHTPEPERSHDEQDERIEQALYESFPASDPPSHTGTTASPSYERSKFR